MNVGSQLYDRIDGGELKEASSIENLQKFLQGSKDNHASDAPMNAIYMDDYGKPSYTEQDQHRSLKILNKS